MGVCRPYEMEDLRSTRRTPGSRKPTTDPLSFCLPPQTFCLPPLSCLLPPQARGGRRAASSRMRARQKSRRIRGCGAASPSATAPRSVEGRSGPREAAGALVAPRSQRINPGVACVHPCPMVIKLVCVCVCGGGGGGGSKRSSKIAISNFRYGEGGRLRQRPMGGRKPLNTAPRARGVVLQSPGLPVCLSLSTARRAWNLC